MMWQNIQYFETYGPSRSLVFVPSESLVLLLLLALLLLPLLLLLLPLFMCDIAGQPA